MYKARRVDAPPHALWLDRPGLRLAPAEEFSEPFQTLNLKIARSGLLVPEQASGKAFKVSTSY